MSSSTDINSLVFYPTPEHNCSYLPGRQARSVFLSPDQTLDESTYMQLTDMGFRRSGEHIYRPWCDTCSKCKSVRVPLTKFNFSKSQKRVIHRNKDLEVSFEEPRFSDEYYELYRNYIDARHADGDMFPPSQEQFTNFLCQPNNVNLSYFVCFRSAGKLVAVSVVDLLPKGVSAIYTFFDPQYNTRSLGRLAILWQISWAQRQGLSYVYLGYWIKNCQKMSYKADYRPLEVFDDLIWQSLES